jgi:ABC-type multidrug transport system ATPase subunit
MNLNVNNLGKRYRGDVWGLRGFTLDIKPGVLGLVGPNGAGKSTLMRILATVTRSTEGEAYWNSNDIAARPNSVRAILGYLPQDFGVYPHLNPIEFLTYLGAARGITGSAGRRRIQQLIELVNLTGVRKRPLGSFSGGMKQRVGIAQALLNDPQLLIVDEPTAGLDPEERVRFRNLLTELAGDRVVILSSHIVSDIEAAATTIAVMSHGRLIAYGTPEEMLKEVEGRVWETVVSSDDLPALKQRFLVSNVTRTSDGARARVVGREPEGAEPAACTLEDAYLHLLAQHRNGTERANLD